MRMIKFYMSKGDDISLPEDKALKIINSEGQLIKITDDKNGEWTGQSINKAHIVSTVVDREATKESQRNTTVRLPIIKKDYSEIKSFLKKYKPQSI